MFLRVKCCSMVWLRVKELTFHNSASQHSHRPLLQWRIFIFTKFTFILTNNHLYYLHLYHCKETTSSVCPSTFPSSFSLLSVQLHWHRWFCPRWTMKPEFSRLYKTFWERLREDCWNISKCHNWSCYKVNQASYQCWLIHEIMTAKFRGFHIPSPFCWKWPAFAYPCQLVAE